MAENSNITPADEQLAANSNVPAAPDAASNETERALEATQNTAPQNNQQQVVRSQNEGNQPARHRGPTDLLPDLVEDSAEPLREVANGRVYEINYIVVASNPQAVESTSKGVTALIEGAGGSVDNLRVSETRRLAYPIEKRHDGVYIVVNARFEKSLTTELDRFFKLDETVLRHLILREDS